MYTSIVYIPIVVDAYFNPYTFTAKVMRADKDVYQHQLLLEETKNPHPFLDALNFLGSCPWKINEKVTHSLYTLRNCVLFLHRY